MTTGLHVGNFSYALTLGVVQWMGHWQLCTFDISEHQGQPLAKPGSEVERKNMLPWFL